MAALSQSNCCAAMNDISSYMEHRYRQEDEDITVIATIDSGMRMKPQRQADRMDRGDPETD
jgi:hypothetical protein